MREDVKQTNIGFTVPDRDAEPWIDIRGSSHTAVPYYRYRWYDGKDRAQRAAINAGTAMRLDLIENPPLLPTTVTTDQSVLFTSVVERSEKRSGGPANEWRHPTYYYYSSHTPALSPLINTYMTQVANTTHERVSDDTWDALCRVKPFNDSKRSVVQVPIVTIESNRGALEHHAMRQVKANSLNAALALMESRKTMDMMADYIRRIAGVAKAIRKKDPRLLKESFRVIKSDRRYTRKSADLWLETVYGLIPTMHDIVGLREAFDRGLREKEQLLVARASSRGTLNDDDSFAYTTTLNGTRMINGRYYDIDYHFDSKYTLSSTLDERVNLWFKVDDPRLLLAKEVGFTNPAVLAWDAVPLWSLLIDWVYPIGQFLDLLDYDLGLSFKGGAFTSFQRTGLRHTETTPTKFDGIHWTETGARGGHRIEFTRNPYLPAHPPKPAPPSLRNPFRVERAVSAVALLRQRLK